MQKAIYTVITNGYDNPPQCPEFSGWDCILFTDDLTQDYKGWDVRPLHKLAEPVLQSREVKILSHVFLPEYDLVCYIDANQKFMREPPSSPIWFRHPRRLSIYDEAKQVIKNGRFDADLINEMMFYYEAKGYNQTGLYLNGFFVREHDARINELHSAWYDETARFVPRDQITLPFAMWLTGITPKGMQDHRSKELYAIVLKPHNQFFAPPVKG